MNNILDKADNILKKVEAAFALVAGMITMFVMLLMALDITLRNLFNYSIISVYEISIYAFVGIIALGFSYVQGQKNNVIVEIATDFLPDLYKNLLDLLGTMIGFFVIGIIVWQNIESTYVSFVGGEYSFGLIQLPIWPSRLVLTLGLMLLNVRLLQNILYILFNLKAEQSTDHGGEAHIN